LAIKKGDVGTLRHRIVIQQLVLTPDGQGGNAESWTTFATVWSELKEVKAWEQLMASELQTRRTHTIRLRYLSGLNTSMRVTYDGRTFYVHGIRNFDERKFFIILDTEEGVGA